MTHRTKLKSHVLEAKPKPGSSLNIVYRRIDELKPDPANPRRHTKKQIHQIAHSITEFGFNGPVLIDGENNVIAGHGRLLACRELGWSAVPTLCLDHLSSAQVRAFRIADNRLTEVSTWDDRLHFRVARSGRVQRCRCDRTKAAPVRDRARQPQTDCEPHRCEYVYRLAARK